MCTTDNGGRLPNYEPNTFGGPHDDHKALDVVPVKVNGSEGHHTYKLADLDFDQPRALYNLLSPEERQNLVENIAASIGAAQIRIQHNVVPHLKRIDPDYGSRVEAILKENNPEY
ncbi:hypothetical protein IW138_005805 [Coemansia sp. RSA 986]|nr:hypothetical protein IW138_005805 [Coemansia sp. RSA 986]